MTSEVVIIFEDGSTPPQPVANFSSLNPGFATFNPLQSRFVLEKLHVLNVNILACWPTSAGKTVIAELITEQTLKKGLKTIYTCPLKALAEEKIVRFKKLFPSYRIEVFTGDYQEVEKRKEKALTTDILITTTELLDSISRHRKFAQELFPRTGAIVIDEAHILGTERGPTVEASLIRITSFNPDIRLIFLSATLSNAKEVAEWIHNLNSKPVYILESSWRPVKIHWHTVPVDLSTATSYPEKIKTLVFNAASLVRNLLRKNPKTAILFFVWTKKEGRMVVEELRLHNIPCAFHNASLDLDQRLKLEKDFDRGKIRVLIATTTLAWGKNTCAEHVIILGTRRGLNFVQPWDVIQAGGRAGRTGLAPRGEVWWLYPFTPQDEKFVKNTLSQTPPVISYLTHPDHLAFHLLGEFHYKKETPINDIPEWFAKTLAFKQINSPQKSITLINQALSLLSETGCIKFFPERSTITLTALGSTAKIYYFSPREMKAFFVFLNRLLNLVCQRLNPSSKEELYNHLKNYFSQPDEEKLGLASVIFLSHLTARNGSFYLSSSEKEELPVLEFSPIAEKFFPTSLSSSFLLSAPEPIRYLVYKWLFWYEENTRALLLNQNRPRIYWKLRDIIVDLDRITLALIDIANRSLNLPVLNDFFTRTSLLLKTGAPVQTVNLLQIKGIGPVRATRLLQIGITTPRELIESLSTEKRHLIEKIIPPTTLKEILENLKTTENNQIPEKKKKKGGGEGGEKKRNFLNLFNLFI